MIAVIDTASSVRHTYYSTLTKMGHSVVVFHSPDTFVNSGAIYKVNLLILGKTRVCVTKSESLLWARFARPNLRTLLPGFGEIELKHLCEAHEMGKVETLQVEICDHLPQIEVALRINNS
jgi:hypothetical protein